MSLLKRIRNKSDQEKTVLAFWIAFVITLVLITFWAFNLSYLLERNKTEEQTTSPIAAQSTRIKELFSGGRAVYEAE